MAAAGAPAARCLTVLLTLAVLLGHPGQALGLQRAGAAAVNPPSYEELTSSLLVNQLAVLQLLQDASSASSCLAERETWQAEAAAAAARDASLQELVKVLQTGQQALRDMVENANQETLKAVEGVAEQQEALRKELTSEMASLRQQTQQQQDRQLEKLRLATCPDGWLRHESSCYVVDGTARTWEESLAYCKGLGGDLAKITSAEEQAFIKAQLSGDTWIGLNERATEGYYVWTDGSAPTYTAWYQGEPNNWKGNDEDCTAMRSAYNYMWNDYPCVHQGGAVCERPLHA